MPAFQWTPIAAIKVGLGAGGLVDPTTTRGYGCVASGTGGVYVLTLNETAGTDEVSVQVTPIAAAGGGVGSTSLPKVTKLPKQGDPLPFTAITIEFQAVPEGINAPPLGFMVRVDRVAIGST